MARTPEPTCPFQPLESGVQATISYQTDGNIQQNVLWFLASSFTTPTNLAALAQVLLNGVQTHILPQMSTSTQLTGIRVVDWTLDTGPVAEISPAVPSFGGIAGPILPLNVTFALHKNTIGRGRGTSGRLYQPAIPRAFQDGNNTILAAKAADLVAAYNSLLADVVLIASPTWQPVVVHKYHNHTCLTNLGATGYNTFTFRDLIFDSQRRRLPGRGA